MHQITNSYSAGFYLNQTEHIKEINGSIENLTGISHLDKYHLRLCPILIYQFSIRNENLTNLSFSRLVNSFLGKIRYQVSTD
jgi:hypothetical protein